MSIALVLGRAPTPATAEPVPQPSGTIASGGSSTTALGVNSTWTEDDSQLAGMVRTAWATAFNSSRTYANYQKLRTAFTSRSGANRYEARRYFAAGFLLGGGKLRDVSDAELAAVDVRRAEILGTGGPSPDLRASGSCKGSTAKTESTGRSHEYWNERAPILPHVVRSNYLSSCDVEDWKMWQRILYTTACGLLALFAPPLGVIASVACLSLAELKMHSTIDACARKDEHGAIIIRVWIWTEPGGFKSRRTECLPQGTAP